MDLFVWIKSVHIFAVVAWMAALLYLPRLFVYHADAKPGGEASETFKVMERRLMRGIANPSMIVVWVTGSWMAFGYVGWSHGWLHAKVALVVGLTVYHHLAVRWIKAFAGDRNVRPARFYRMVNEIPAVLLALIIILVVVRPF